MTKYTKEYYIIQELNKKKAQEEFEQSNPELKKKLDEVYDLVKLLTQEVESLKQQVSELKQSSIHQKLTDVQHLKKTE